MNRIEFMTELAALLQNIPEEEKIEAMQFYNDYFDDAGEENEYHVIAELGSPAKVAATIKEELKNPDTDAGEYTETGYSDSRFEEKDPPARREYHYKEEKEGQSYQYQGDAAYQSQKKPLRTSRALKIILIIAIALVAAPVVLPVVFGIVAAILGCIIALFGVFVAFVVVAVAVVIVGIWLIGAGIIALVPQFPVGLALLGAGLIVTVLGVIATVAGVKLCIVVIPGIFRGIVNIFRKLVQRKAVHNV